MRERNSQESRARRDVAVKTPTARPALTTPATVRERNLAVNRDETSRSTGQEISTRIVNGTPQ